jgi:hypothetical protein
MVTSATIAHVIKQRFRLAELPFDLSMNDAGLKHEDLLIIQQVISHKLSKHLEVSLNDTVYTITNKINK